jgi:gamma-glutamylcyclotransferase (GGCT)/AIG2-like uncharacterized protein YtfP
MIKYFAYGMNTNLDSMQSRCPTAQSLGCAILPAYEFRFANHADILENPEFDTYGVLWDITREDLRSLDALEGYPFYYDRKVVEVIHNGQPVRAITYFMQPGNPDRLPATSYYEMVQEGYLQNGVPVYQLEEAINFINTYDSLPTYIYEDPYEY